MRLDLRYMSLTGGDMGLRNWKTGIIIKLILNLLCCISLSFSLSQLLGNGGDMKEGETARKRMKISVPHFDNFGTNQDLL
ncbi:hypothetical protein Bca52824_093479 [Brassica carinata]|uniref:Transmembrane protein n=1 Tax=Brassica carinata TaxID=52824 RepID=A0A8X7P5S9_BRACI|nr:hypothetical protein Bca52824_093479 [Brassica carinata]